MAIEINVYLGIIWNNSDPQRVKIQSLDFLTTLGKIVDLNQLPLHWGIPSFPLLEKNHHDLQDLTSTIRQRIKTSGDVIMAMGYGHNLHPGLSTNECKYELTWNIENPWKSGIKDIFEYKPEILMPGLVDLYRKESIENYIELGFNKIAIPSEHFRLFNHNLKQFETLFDFDYFIYDSIYPELPIDLNRNFKKAVRKGLRDFILFLDLKDLVRKQSETASTQNMESFFQKLISKYSVKFKSLQDENQKGSLHTIEFQVNGQKQTCYKNTVLNRGLIQSVHKKRKDFLQQEKIHDVLIELSPLGQRKLSSQAQEVLFPPASRFNDASMPGEARMTSKAFTVIFRSGQIADLESNGKNLLCSRTSRSYVHFNSHILEAENLSTFSIMDEVLHGLRDIQLINHPDWASPMKMVTDYFFIDNFPLLLAAARLDYPDFNTSGILQSIAPYELSLFEMGPEDELVITAYSDSFDYRQTIRAEASQYLLAGNYFHLNYHQQDIILGYPPQIDPCLSFMEFRVKEQDEKYLFQANLFGSYLNSSLSEWNRKSEEASFFIGIEPDGGLPEFSPKIIKELPQPKVWFRK